MKVNELIIVLEPLEAQRRRKANSKYLREETQRELLFLYASTVHAKDVQPASETKLENWAIRKAEMKHTYN